MNKHISFRRLWVGVLLLPLGPITVGCGSSQGTVSGKVSYKGKAIPAGSVSIVPAKGGLVKAEIQEDGSYTIYKVPPGPAKFAVETESAKPSPKAPQQAMGAAGYYAKMPKGPPGGAPGGGDPSKFRVAGQEEQKDPKKYVPIPEKYRDPDSAGLSYTVKGGKQEYNIDLK